MLERQRRDDLTRELVPRVVRTVSDDVADGVVLYEIIDSIPAVYRDAFVLVKVMGLTHEEVGSVLGCPTGTVQSRVARARVLLTRLIDNPAESLGWAQ